MPLRNLSSASSLIYQCSGSPESPAAVYLPGVHGCWTPVDRAQPILNQKLNFLEIAYPYFDQLTLEEYATQLAAVLDTHDIESVHLIGESFGSLVAWQFAMLHPKRVRSHILLGGMTQAPGLQIANSAHWALHFIPNYCFEKIVDCYVAFKALRGEPRQGAGPGVRAYPAVRTMRGQRATANRMRIIQTTDFRSILSEICFPVRYLGGEKDWVVPVNREIKTLRTTLPSSISFESELIKRAPHAIIASHPIITSNIILNWIDELEAH